MNRAMTLSLAVSLVLLATAGCNRNDEAATTADTTQPGTPATSSTPAVDSNADTSAAAGTSGDATNTAPAGSTATAPAAGTLTQGQAVALVGTVDKHEIAAAEQAKGKKVTGEVADYATMLHREHSKNLEAGRMLGASETSPEATAMEEKGKAELSALDQKSGKDYEKAYVDAMVKGHEEALALIDTRLLPAAQDEKVRTFLTNSREHVAMHLEKGKSLQAKAGGSSQ